MLEGREIKTGETLPCLRTSAKPTLWIPESISHCGREAKTGEALPAWDLARNQHCGFPMDQREPMLSALLPAASGSSPSLGGGSFADLPGAA